MTLGLFTSAPEEWERTTLGEVVKSGGGSIQTGPFGSQLHASDYVSSGIPSIMPTNIGDNRISSDGIACITEDDAERLSKHIVHTGDIIYSRRGDVEKRALVREEEDGWFCGTGCLKVRFGAESVSSDFASFYLGHPEVKEWIVRHAVGATMPNLNTSIMEAIPFLRPPRDEQRAIAGVLASLDDKIEQNRRAAAKLEELAGATFRAWFVDFAPVHAKAAGAKSYPGLHPEAFADLPTTFEPADLGPIPEGWQAKPLDEACTINPKLRLKKDEEAPYLDMKNMPTQGHRPNEVYDRPFGSGMRFQNGDTLVARITPCLENGKTAFVDFLEDEQIAWGSTEYIVIRPKPPLPPTYGYCLARTKEFRDFAIQNMSGTSGRQRVPPKAMSHFMIAVPTDPVAQAFGQSIGPLFDLIRQQDEESQKLAELRDYLLPRLLSGSVRVRDVEAAAEGAV